MPVIILTGQPAVGKTYVANSFVSVLQKLHAADSHLNKDSKTDQQNNDRLKSISQVILLNEENLLESQSKEECYVNSHAEKVTRQTLKAGFERSLGGMPPSQCVIDIIPKPTTTIEADDTTSISCSSFKNVVNKSNRLVILDSMNYMKGYRYELHCVARAKGEQYCVVSVLSGGGEAGDEIATKRNYERDDNQKLTNETMEGLVQRYEPPDERHRWDKPLYRIYNGSTAFNDCSDEKRALEKSVYNMHNLKESLESKNNNTTIHNLRDQTHTNLEDQILQVLQKFMNESGYLKANVSTQPVIAAKSNVLQEADMISQKVVNSIVSAQKLQGVAGGSCKVVIPELCSKSITLLRPLRLPELRKFKNAFIKWVQSHPPSDTSESGVASAFLSYIEAQL